MCAEKGIKVIAATVCKEKMGMAAAADRLRRCREHGADLVCCKGLKTTEESEAFAKLVDGPKMLDAYPGENTDLDLDALARAGYGLVTVEYVIKASLYGLMQFGLRCRRDNNTVYVDYHDFDGPAWTITSDLTGTGGKWIRCLKICLTLRKENKTDEKDIERYDGGRRADAGSLRIRCVVCESHGVVWL